MYVSLIKARNVLSAHAKLEQNVCVGIKVLQGTYAECSPKHAIRVLLSLLPFSML